MIKSSYYKAGFMLFLNFTSKSVRIAQGGRGKCWVAPAWLLDVSPFFFCTKYSGVKKVGGQCVATVLLLPMMPSDSLISIHTLRPARYVEVPSCEEDWCRALVIPLPSQ